MEYNKSMEKHRFQAYIPMELYNELKSSGDQYGLNLTVMTTICLRAGLDVLKVALSTDYAKVMQMLSREYESKDE